MQLARPFRLVIPSFLALPVALVVACSDETAAAPATNPAPNDASAPEDAAVDVAVEASVPRPTEIVQAPGDSSVGASCDSVCAMRGGSLTFKCGACEPSTGAVGEASYRDYSTNPAGKKDTDISTCAESVPKMLEDGASYELWSYNCCCEAPKLEEVAAANVASPMSCAEVCSAKGLSCDPKNVWGDLGDGPFELTYDCDGYELTTTTSGNDNSNTVSYDCADIPTATFVRTTGGGSTCTLASYTCACR